jgi:hypothetical protein
MFRAYDPATRPSGALGKGIEMGIRERLAKVGLVCVIGAAISAPMAPLSAFAIAPVGNLLLQVTDCATGQPINIGEAYFSAHVGVGVAPIENGTVGPIGLGALKFVLTLTSPGYRPLHRVLQGTGPTGPVRNIPLCLHAVAGSPVHAVTTTYSIDITCTPASAEVCTPVFSTPISSADILRLQFTAASTNCGAITLDFQEDGFDVYITDQLAPGDSTPTVNVGPVIPGTHLLTVQATGVEGGCNVGTLDSWGGTLTVVTVLPVGPTTTGQCINGGWAGFSAFRNEGACINYVVTAGKHA